MKKKNLVLLTSSYPIFIEELFLDDEVNVLSIEFDNIYVICFHDSLTKINRNTPKNLTVFSIENKIEKAYKIQAFISLIPKTLFKEYQFVKNNFGLKFSFSILKNIIYYYALARFQYKNLLAILKDKNIDANTCVFYSYWHNSMALALTMLKEKNNEIVCISRSHGWDIDYKRHNPAYLPFKEKIIKSIDVSFTISNQARQLLLKLLKGKNEDKIKIARMGSSNHRNPIFKKINTGFTICSCSVLYSIKRVHLIADIIKSMKIKNIEWIHFGDGQLKDFIQDYCFKNIPEIKFTITGMIPNKEILDFYSNNYVDLFINVSESEGVPVSIMEAQSAGIPVLATNVGGVSEIINESNGFLIEKKFEIEKVSRIIDEYFQLDEDRKEKFRFNIYQFWKENYNASNNYKKFIDQIREISTSKKI